MCPSRRDLKWLVPEINALITAQFTVHASLAGRDIVLDFAINKQWKVNLTLMTYTMLYY